MTEKKKTINYKGLVKSFQIIIEITKKVQSLVSLATFIAVIDSFELENQI